MVRIYGFASCFNLDKIGSLSRFIGVFGLEMFRLETASRHTIVSTQHSILTGEQNMYFKIIM